MPREVASHPFDLTGKIALITGSTKGIGLATARVLAKAGARVIISSRKADECETVAKTLVEEGLSAEPFACHIGRMEDIARITDHLHKEHGGIDILVNNAVLSPWRTIDDTDLDLFTKTVEVNLRGYWYLSKEVTKLMKARGGGSIVNIASVSALHPERMLGLYSTLKTALIGMSRAFALEYGADGIRANTVVPGVFKTRLADAFDSKTKEKLLAKLPLGRLGEPEEVGYAILFLSAASGAYITGASLIIDGGMTISTI